jgi:hypothetical protein
MTSELSRPRTCSPGYSEHVASIGFDKRGSEAFDALTPAVRQRFRAYIEAIAENPYGTGRVFATVEEPYDRVLTVPEGWIRYVVRVLEDPEVVITDLSWIAL